MEIAGSSDQSAIEDRLLWVATGIPLSRSSVGVAFRVCESITIWEVEKVLIVPWPAYIYIVLR